MKRIYIGGLICAAAAVPVAAGSVFLFGCCALPFHQVVHRYLPICGHIVKAMTADSHHDQKSRTVVTKKHSPFSMVARAQVRVTQTLHRLRLVSNSSRDRMSHGALRCDDDVGLVLLFRVMLI